MLLFWDELSKAPLGSIYIADSSLKSSKQF